MGIDMKTAFANCNGDSIGFEKGRSGLVYADH